MLLDDKINPQCNAFAAPGGLVVFYMSLIKEIDGTFWRWDGEKKEKASAFGYAHEVTKC